MTHRTGTLLATLLVVFSAALASAQIHQPLPALQRLEPTSGPPGTTVELNGRYFVDDQTLWLGEVQLEVLTRLPNRWTVRIPPNAQSGNVQIRTRDRGNVEGPRFRVSEALPAPTIASFAPTSGPPGTEVTITGEHFSTRIAENLVHMGESPVVVRQATPTTLMVIVPNNAQSAPFRVDVTGASSVTASTPFNVTVGTAIASFEPPVATPGARVIVHGSGFSRRANEVLLSVHSAGSLQGEGIRLRVVRASETEIEGEVPRNAASITGPLFVEVRRTSRATSSTPFEVRPAPVIRALEPAFGATGTRITIRGASFGRDVRQIAVHLGEAVLPVRDLGEDFVVAELPAGAANGPIELTAGGLGPARSPHPFEVVPAVTVTGFSPQSGGSATVVTILGSGFSTELARNHVTLGTAACEAVRVTADQLQVRIPIDTPSGPLVVRVENAGEARTQQPFVVTRAPQIASFEPVWGPSGTSVTIRGRNFGTRAGLLDVHFGDAQAEVQHAADEEVVVTVPPQAVTGPIRVSVRLQGTAISTTPFTVATEAPVPPTPPRRGRR